MIDALTALMQSRKAVAVFVAVTCATVLCALGKIPVDHLVNFCGALTGVLVAAIAAEDAAAKRSGGAGDRPIQ